MKRFWIIVGALAVTGGTLTIAMLLGAAGFDFRRYTQHEGRLQRVMREQPTVERLTQAFQDEGTAQLAAPAGKAEADEVIAAHGGARVNELRQKAARYPQLRLYRAGDMLYFVFFDGDGVMRDFTCVSA
jgi:hypothetical protein